MTPSATTTRNQQGRERETERRGESRRQRQAFSGRARRSRGKKGFIYFFSLFFRREWDGTFALDCICLPRSTLTAEEVLVDDLAVLLGNNHDERVLFINDVINV